MHELRLDFISISDSYLDWNILGIKLDPIPIKSPEMSLENILESQIEDITVHLISHGREDPIGALNIKPNPYQSIKVSAGALAGFFLYNRPRSGTFEIKLIDLVACNSLQLALCLSLLIPISRIQGYENPVAINEEGNIVLYNPKTQMAITSTSSPGLVPCTRFAGGQTFGEDSKIVGGLPPIDFKLNEAITKTRSEREFQIIQHNIQISFFPTESPKASCSPHHTFTS